MFNILSRGKFNNDKMILIFKRRWPWSRRRPCSEPCQRPRWGNHPWQSGPEELAERHGCAQWRPSRTQWSWRGPVCPRILWHHSRWRQPAHQWAWARTGPASEARSTCFIQIWKNCLKIVITKMSRVIFFNENMLPC